MNRGDGVGATWLLIGMGFMVFAINAMLFALAAGALAAALVGGY
jgi:hypothetical protein